MDQQKRDQRFQEHQVLMGKLSTHYQNWSGKFPPPNPLDTLIQTHSMYTGIYSKIVPKNDDEMETLKEDTVLYMSATQDEVDKLRSYGYPAKHKTLEIQYYTDILEARDEVEDWIDKVQEELKPAVAPPSGLNSDNSLFIALLDKLLGTITPVTPIIKEEIVDKTKQLIDNQFNNQLIELTDTQINELLDAWQQIVTAFSEDPIGTTGTSPRPDGVIEAIISFDAVQSDLEILYNQLTTNVKRATEDSLDSLLFSLY